MFDISALKELKLSELQEIAKTAKTIKFNGVKKETLIGLILEHQAATTKVVDTVISNQPPGGTGTGRMCPSWWFSALRRCWSADIEG